MIPRRVRLLFLTLLPLTLAAEGKVPPIWPQIQGIFPRGGQRGAAVKITLKGRNLQQTRELRFRSPHLTARVLSATPYQVEALVTLAPSAEPGRHDLRLLAPHGSAIGYFDVGTVAERTEKEPNNHPAQAEPLPFPALVNGILTAGDYDYFRLEAAAGQTLTFDVLATRNGASTDAALALLNEAGDELAFSDDYYGFKDPHLRYTFAKTGRYLLRVHGSSEAGCDTCDYRLRAGTMPHVETVIPAGGQPGQPTTITLRGVNLRHLAGVTLGDGQAEGEVLTATATEATVRLTVPPHAAPGVYKLHGRDALLPASFVVSTFPELAVADGSARSRKDPLPVTLPVIANGILNRPRAADHFAFRVDGPETVVLEAHAMQLGYLTDPLVALYDESGNRLAWQDDPTTNTGKEPANLDPHLVFRLPRAGRYTAMIRDAQFRGDPAFLYRLTIKKADPDFSLRVVGTDDTLYRGHTNTILVRVRRLEGWNEPVEVYVPHLPPGVSVQPVVAEPKNTPYTGTCGETHYLDGTNVEMQITVAPDAPPLAGPLEFRGRSRGVERIARTRYFRARIRHIGDAEEDHLRVTIADAPGAVLTVPPALALGKDHTAALTVIVTRLDEGRAEPLDLAIEAAADGITATAAPVPPTTTRAELRLRAEAKAPGEFVVVARRAGAVIGRSHPIRLRSPQ